jgi:hypothetical protein
MAAPNYLYMAAAAVGGVLLLIFAWSFLSNAQLGITLLVAKDATGFFPFIGTFFLYTLGLYFIVFFVAAIFGFIYIETHPQQTSVAKS